MQNAFGDHEEKDITSQRRVSSVVLIDKPGLILKWNFSFVALLLLHGNGQRNQVQTFLKCTSVAEMFFETEHGGSKAKVLLKILIHEDEKRLRDNRMPFVRLDLQVFDFVNFHVQFYQPFLLDRYAIQKGTKYSQKLLLDTRNGHSMTSDNVRNTLFKFRRAVDPELHLKPMMLCSSYATITIRRHVHPYEIEVAEHFQALTEDEFCELLAAVMNTSVTQIRIVYASASHADYSAHVARIMSICKRIPDCDEFDADC